MPVVDTNVWVSGLILPDSVSGRVVDAIRTGAIEAVVSWELAEEITEVLRRPRIRRYGIEERDVEDVLAALAPFLPTVEVDVSVRDPDDAPVVIAAVAGRADAVVTGDQDLLDDEHLRAWLRRRRVEVMTPAEALERIGAPPGSTR
jgi:uncharacterized protein